MTFILGIIGFFVLWAIFPAAAGILLIGAVVIFLGPFLLSLLIPLGTIFVVGYLILFIISLFSDD